MLQIDRHLKSLNENTENVSLVLTLHFVACSFPQALTVSKASFLLGMTLRVERDKNIIV